MAWCRTSCTCPACASSSGWSTRASSAGSCRCAASSATGCSRATGKPAQRPSLELPRRGRRRHHRGHVPPLALCARPTRSARCRSVYAHGRDAHPGALGRAGATRTTPPPTTPRTRTFESRRRHRRADQLAPGPCGCIATSWSRFQVDGTRGSAVAGLRKCNSAAPRRHPEAGVEPGPRRPLDFRDQWHEVPDNGDFDNGSRAVGAVPAACRAATRRSAATFTRAHAACSWPSSACSPGARAAGSTSRAADDEVRMPLELTLPRAGGALETITGSATAALPVPANRSFAAASPTPRRTSSAIRWRDADLIGAPAIDWDATLAYRHHLGSLGFRGGRGDGHRAARHGPGLGLPRPS